MKTHILALLLLVASIGSQASQEGALALSNFRLESNGAGSSGNIVIEGKQNDKAQMVALRISAFGKDYIVPSEKLKQLAELRPNGVRISYEDGYKELGGRTVYIQFQAGFTSATVRKALITLTEDGKIEASGIENEKSTGPSPAIKNQAVTTKQTNI